MVVCCKPCLRALIVVDAGLGDKEGRAGSNRHSEREAEGKLGLSPGTYKVNQEFIPASPGDGPCESHVRVLSQKHLY